MSCLESKRKIPVDSIFVNNDGVPALVLDSPMLGEPIMPLRTAAKKKRDFDPKKFLATIGEGRKIVPVAKKQTIYAQGAACDAVFYIQTGKVRLTVVAKNGKEATIGILNPGDFFGEGGLGGTASTHGVCNRDDRL